MVKTVKSKLAVGKTGKKTKKRQKFGSIKDGQMLRPSGYRVQPDVKFIIGQFQYNDPGLTANLAARGNPTNGGDAFFMNNIVQGSSYKDNRVGRNLRPLKLEYQLLMGYGSIGMDYNTRMRSPVVMIIWDKFPNGTMFLASDVFEQSVRGFGMTDQAKLRFRILKRFKYPTVDMQTAAATQTWLETVQQTFEKKGTIKFRPSDRMVYNGTSGLASCSIGALYVWIFEETNVGWSGNIRPILRAEWRLSFTEV